MSADEPSEESPGVFGNLPKTRPGARSPRRDDASARQTSKPEPKPSSAGSGTKAAPPHSPATDKVPDPTVASERSGGIEEVAWAGVAAAAEAATIGVRLATKALEAMRGTVDRR